MSGLVAVALEAHCTAPLPVLRKSCYMGACPSLYWLPSEEWQACSHNCVDVSSPERAALTLGVANVTRPVCMRVQSSGVAVQTVDADCGLLPVLFANTSATRACNRFPCPSSVAVWHVGEWSNCTVGTKTASSGCQRGVTQLGTRSRHVTCDDYAGNPVVGDRCNQSSSALHLYLPSNMESCVLDVVDDHNTSCQCSSTVDCGSDRMECERGECVCADGWLGRNCSVIALPQTVPSACMGGVIDVRGTCCHHAIDAHTGMCCSVDSVLDISGLCCVASSMDACGVCGGTGVSVDVRGQCCSSALPPSGICCDEGLIVDDCGVCGGTNDCQRVMTVQIANSSSSVGGFTSADIASAIGVSAVNSTITVLAQTPMTNCSGNQSSANSTTISVSGLITGLLHHVVFC